MFLQHQLACPLGQQVNNAGVEVAFPSMSMLWAQVTATQCKPITTAECNQLQVNTQCWAQRPLPGHLLLAQTVHMLCLCACCPFPNDSVVTVHMPPSIKLSSL